MRDFRSVLFLAGLTAAMATADARETLPLGVEIKPLETPHFPDRLHAVVWRNWQLVEPARIARAVGTTEANIRAVAESMGLPPVSGVSPRWRERGFITIVRRNWHLLPYEQLLVLLDMSAEDLAFALREDDFLFIKLGTGKPRCEPVAYVPPDDRVRRRTAEIRRIVADHFGVLPAYRAEQPFAFVDAFAGPGGNPVEPVPASGGERAIPAADEPPRFLFSYCSTFGDPLADETLAAFPEGMLRELAANKVNGVWLHVVLRQLAPGGPDFPEFGAGHERRLENLRRLVARAARHGIAIYLYLNEPRSMPVKFFENRPEMAGVPDTKLGAKGEFRAMCTTDPRVNRWLTEALAHVFTKVPGLGGVFTITASENLTSCASHGGSTKEAAGSRGSGYQDCPRCGRRDPDAIIAEVNAAIAAGVHRGSPKARVIVWDWGWNSHGDAPGIIEKLPKDVSLMSVSEWALPIERGGVKAIINEYSISAPGPGPRATRHWQLAEQAGLGTVAKVQLNNSWELSAVPYLPVMDLVAQHCGNLARLRVGGLLMSWSLGGYPSPNLRIAARFAEEPEAAVADVLDGLARERYGAAAAPHARRAWTTFSRAFSEFPSHIKVEYFGPQQYGPANLLHRQPTGQQASTVLFCYDDFDKWRGPYPREVFTGQMRKVAAGWAQGIVELQRAAAAAEGDQRRAAEADLLVARAAGFHVASAANQADFIIARDALGEPGLPEAESRLARERMLGLLGDETAIAKRFFEVCQADSRIGFEASNHYYYVPLDFVEKVLNCEHVRGELQPVAAP
jgi:hypothetical protein